jgi:hypothetical protein
LIDKISDSGYGAKLGISYSNIIAYADDLVLISPSVVGLQYLLNLVNAEIDKIGLNFNTKKSAVVKFGFRHFLNMSTEPTFFLAGDTLKSVEDIKYLGIYINRYLEEKSDIIRARGKFFNVFNCILRIFNSGSPDMMAYLLRSFCLPMYGADLWLNYSNCSQIINQLRVGYHKAIKKIYNVSYRESNHVICNETGFLTFDHLINYVKLNSMFRILIKPCRFVQKNIIPLSRGILSRNLCGIFKNVYGVVDIYNNDICALKARIWRVQNCEDSLR